MQKVAHLPDADNLPDYGIRDGQRCWLPINGLLYRRLIHAGGGERWRAQILGQSLIQLGLCFLEGKDGEVPIEMIEAYRRDARSVFDRETRRLGGPPKRRLSDHVVSVADLVGAE